MLAAIKTDTDSASMAQKEMISLELKGLHGSKTNLKKLAEKAKTLKGRLTRVDAQLAKAQGVAEKAAVAATEAVQAARDAELAVNLLETERHQTQLLLSAAEME